MSTQPALETLGRYVKIDTGGHIVSGIAARVNPDGSLVVITDQGEVAVSAGNLASGHDFNASRRRTASTATHTQYAVRSTQTTVERSY